MWNMTVAQEGPIRPKPAYTLALELPPLIQTAQRTTRRVGVEIKFARLSARQAAKALAMELGGTVIKEDHHAFVVQGTRLGDITVELDLRHIHPQRRDVATRLRLGRRSAASSFAITTALTLRLSLVWRSDKPKG